MDDFDIPIFKKTYEFYKEIYLALRNFSRQDRYSLGQRCEEAILEVLEDILCASRVARERKSEFLERAIRKLAMVQVYIRLAKDIRALDMKRYIVFSESLGEIGRMLGGWLKMANQRN